MPNKSSFSKLPRTGPVTVPGSREELSPAKRQLLESASSSRRLLGALILPVTMVVPSGYQVRKHFDQVALQELAADISERGILEPLIVRSTSAEEGHYEIIAGERRYRAALLAGLKEVPVIVKEMDDQQARFTMLVENIQREDLRAEDEQAFFQQLQNEYNLGLAEIAKLINKSKSYVDRRLKGDLISLQLNSKSNAGISEKDNNIPVPGRKLQNSQLVEKTTASAKAKFSPTAFRRAGLIFDKTLTVITTEQPDEKTIGQIRQSVAEIEQKLAELKQQLDKFAPEQK